MAIIIVTVASLALLLVLLPTLWQTQSIQTDQIA